MKGFTIFILIFTLISCNQTRDNKVVYKVYKFDTLINEIKEKYPNYGSNDYVKEKASVYLDKKIDSILKLGYLEEITYSVFDIKSSKNVKGGVVQFINETGYKDGKNLRLLKYEVICVATDSLVSIIDKTKKYKISGKPLLRLDDTKISIMTKQTYYSPKTYIDYQGYYHLGVFLFELEGVTQID
jgi:hypothetical protein